MGHFYTIVHALVLSGSYAASLDLGTLKQDFNSDIGVMLRIQDLAARTDEYPASTTVWRKDLPLALYSVPHRHEIDTAGVIMQQKNVHVVCGYPIDANTVIRVKPNTETRDSCGVMGKRGGGFIFDPNKQSGRCNFSTPQDYAKTYFYKPMVNLGLTLWTLEYATCSFASLTETLEAQKALLMALMNRPENMTLKDAVGNATHSGSGLTGFNEVIVAPYNASAVGGVFWAHEGPFREPSRHDTGACKIQSYLKHATDSLPIFELAYTNLERPFAGCSHGSLFPEVSLDCLSRGLGEWQGNLTSDGGRDADTVFRIVDASTFRALWCGWPEEESGNTSVESKSSAIIV